MEKTDSRTKNSLRNITFATIYYIMQLIITLFLRVAFLRVFVVEYLGINTLFSNILTLLSVVESGFSSAMVFALYKPVSENKEQEIQKLIHLYKKIYGIIAYVILGLGLLITPALPFIIKDFYSIDLNLYVLYLIFIFNSFLTYFTAHRRSLFYATQRNDLESKINIICHVFLAVIQFVAIVLIKNFYAYSVTTIINTIVTSLIIVWVTNKHYKNYLLKPKDCLDQDSKNAIIKNVKALFLHRIGSIVLSGTDSIIMSAFVGLVVLGKYSNYLMITTYLNGIISMCLSAIRGSVGNAISLNSKEDNLVLFSKLNMMYSWIISVFSVCLVVLSNPFISIVFGQHLILDMTTVVVIGVNFYLYNIRQLLNVFKDCKGLFWENRFAPIIESIINLVASLILVRFLGVAGVLIGTIISNILVPLWNEPYVINKNYFKRSNLLYMLKLCFCFVLTAVGGVITFLVVNIIPDTNIGMLILKFIVCGFMSVGLLTVVYLMLKDFRMFLGNFFKKIKLFFKKSK